MAWDFEIESFKRFDLRIYAASLGYIKDDRRSGKHSSVMRRDGEKILVTLDTDKHYVYLSFSDDLDQGTIIDFVQRRKGFNIGRVRRELRPWISGSARPTVIFSPLQTLPKNRQNVTRAYYEMDDAPNAYLQQTRALPLHILLSPRFVGRISTDRRGNAVFPHFDEQGLCGFELKGSGFTSFSRGGEKGLWISRRAAIDATLVITESPIDALSYAALFANAAALYASTGGTFNRRQVALILKTVSRLPLGGRVIAAMDHDAAGKILAARIENIVKDRGRIDITFQAGLPPQEGFDWNDVLRN